MSSSLERSLKHMPGALRWLRRRKGQRHRRKVAALNTAISARNDHEILVVFGMRRSGNHLAINWLLEQINGPVVFYNNIDPTRDPHTAYMVEYRDRKDGKSPRIVLSYEDLDPDTILSGPLRGFLQSRPHVPVRFALILRDPYNLFASRLQKWPETFATEASVKAQTDLYCTLAGLAEKPAPIWENAPLIPVIYNDLISDAQARDRTADALGIKRGGEGLDHVPAYGHGSSFDGTDLKAAQVKTQVFERWRRYAQNPNFQSALAVPEVQRLGEILFDMPPPKELLNEL